MTDDIPQELEPELSIGTIIIGAWKEALTASGVERAVLVPLVAMITIPVAPLWLTLMLLEAVGLYDVEEGFTLP